MINNKHTISFALIGIILVIISIAFLGMNSGRATVGPALVKITGGGCCGLWPANLIKAGNILFFTDYDGTDGSELWKSDGTANGTVMVKDINPGIDDSNPNNLTDVNGTLFFSAIDGVHGVELWKSDGTAGGTVMVKDINPGSGDSNLWHLLNANGTAYFAADDGTHGMEVWKSDGTESGTVMVKDINPGSDSSSPQNLTYCNGSVYFTAQPGAMMSSTIYKTDGTDVGTVTLALPGMATPNSLFCAGGTLYYTANNIGGNTGVELGKTDGTDDGTMLVKDINPGGDSSYPQNFADINGILYFSATDGTHGAELWKSDGTAGGTVMVKDINPGSGDSSPAQFFDNNDGMVYFDASDGPHGEELWKTDGTESGTVMVKDINLNNGDSWPGSFTNMYGAIYFDATNVSGGKGGSTKYQLYKTDGTESGTVAIADLNPGGDDSVSSLTKIGNTLFFTADDGVNGTQLWTYGLSAPPVIAAITTSEPTQVSTSTMTLNASITDNGRADATESGFAYGMTNDLSTVIATTALGSQTGNASFSQGLAGLILNTTYYFRAYAVNSAGTSTGAILSTTTLAVSTPAVIAALAPSYYGSSGGSIAALTSAQAQAKQVDILKDGMINIIDFNAMMVNWGRTVDLAATGSVKNSADMNDDGVVDILDFNMLMVLWGTTYQL